MTTVTVLPWMVERGDGTEVAQHVGGELRLKPFVGGRRRVEARSLGDGRSYWWATTVGEKADACERAARLVEWS